MSQKAWMSVYTRGTKEMQARLARVHASNPEFQEFVKKHGFGGNLSKKQSELQKKGSVQTVKPVTDPHPERKDLSGEAVWKAAFEKHKARRLANANRVAFGGELGGGFQLPGSSFRRYSEATEKWKVSDVDDKYATMKNAKGDTVRVSRKTWNLKKNWTLHGSKSARGRFRPVAEETLNELSKDRLQWYVKHALRNMNDLDDQGGFNLRKSVKRAQGIHRAKRKMANEDIAYKDGTIAMYKGGWIAKRAGKRLGNIMPTDDHAKQIIDATRKSLAQKTMGAIKSKAQEVMKGFAARKLATEAVSNITYKGLKSLSKQLPKSELKQMSPEDQASFQRIRKHFAKRANVAYLGGKKVRTESAHNRRRIRSWDSAVMPELKPLTVKPKKKLPFDADPPKDNPGVVVGKNDPSYSRVRHLARLGLRKAMEQGK